MRTTVTLDPDVDAKLRELARRRGKSFKEVLNDAVRAGIETSGSRRRTFRVAARSMGLRSGINLDKALQLTGDLEDAELLHRIELRK